MTIAITNTLKRSFKSKNFLFASLIMFSLGIDANDCLVDGIHWNCISNDSINISNATESFFGSPPELNLTIEWQAESGSPFLPLELDRLPSDFSLNDDTVWKVKYALKNGLSDALTESGVKPLPAGLFDIDGDPIDNQRVYDSIKWYIHDPKSTPTDSDSILLPHPFDEFSITPENCIAGYTISVSAIPFTVTGEPDSGNALFKNILKSDGTPFILDNCSTLDIFDKEILTVITNQKGIYLVDQVDPTRMVNNAVQVGDELTAEFFIINEDKTSKDLFINVTNKVLPTLVWGYYLLESDDIHGDGSLNNIVEEIWMDGNQKTNEDVPTDARDTTGLQRFKIQDNNKEARALQTGNQSEQSMRIRIKFGKTK